MNLNLGPTLNNATFVLDGILPIISFLPLIKEVAEVINETVEIVQLAEHNKKICGILWYRIHIAETALWNLKNRRDKNENFFSNSNLTHLQKLVNIIKKIRKFVEEISQLTGLSKYIQAKSIESNVKELSSEFDFTIQAFHFSLAFDFSIRAEQDSKDIKSDLDDLTKYLDDIGSGVTDNNHMILNMVAKLSTLNKLLTESKSKTNTDIFKSELLEYSDFEEQEPDGNRHLKSVKKFRRKHGLNDFVALKLVAVKNSSEEDKDNFRKQVTILKKSDQCDSIIQYFGLTAYDYKYYLVTEWAEYGNLPKGLNFLNAAKIVHRDIRPENILITDHETAKIANFKAREITYCTTYLALTLEAVRYCAPEQLERRSEYDTKCEKYGNDIIVITELVCTKKFRESFSLGTSFPKEYQDLAKKAVDHDHNFRPRFSKIYTILQDLYKKDSRYTPLHSPKLVPKSETLANDINFAEFNYMSVDEASKQHRLPNGNRELAYKCFEANAEYFKAYYIQQNLVKFDMNQATKDILVADLYKEVADSGDSEAQLHYGNCLFKGIGVKKNLKEAAEYFTKAAENGQVVGMYNAATLYFSDSFGLKNEVLEEIKEIIKVAQVVAHPTTKFVSKIWYDSFDKPEVLDPEASDGKNNLYSCSSRHNFDINKLALDSNAKETSESKISNDSNHERIPTPNDKINDLDPEKTPTTDGPTLNTTTFVLDGILPLLSFLPLIKEVAEVFNEIIEIYQSAEHNKKKYVGYCWIESKIADTALRNLKNQISQLTGLSKYIQAKSIESNVKELSKYNYFEEQEPDGLKRLKNLGVETYDDKYYFVTEWAERYCAPEKLERRSEYDTKCEVYSFGILLWEIAEEKSPYERYDDILAITELVCNKQCREPFSFAVHQDHIFRPQFSKIYTILQDLYKKDAKYTPLPSPKLTPKSETLVRKVSQSLTR
ncbi:1654_t:CDS:10 [Funneliformis geosporum]|nr:1654_t:CDS:10 [Funneliformis geosporum]